ncbi:MAG: hypothetical protein HC827_17125 [Cyanobacteria bacterium RM1_2_2]|nr:hypothetical protein [Cyanobacteria bacterium RM1_2_2]
MPTLDQVLDIALQLPLEQQTMLIEIIRHRQIEARRAEIAAHAQQAITAFHQGQLTPQSAETAITELRQFLSDETEA